MQWINIKDKLPKKNVEVLGALKGCDSGKYVLRPVEYVHADDHEWESEGFEIANCWDVTHWMPMPEPPCQDACSECEFEAAYPEVVRC